MSRPRLRLQLASSLEILELFKARESISAQEIYDQVGEQCSSILLNLVQTRVLSRSGRRNSFEYRKGSKFTDRMMSGKPVRGGVKEAFASAIKAMPSIFTRDEVRKWIVKESQGKIAPKPATIRSYLYKACVANQVEKTDRDEIYKKIG